MASVMSAPKSRMAPPADPRTPPNLPNPETALPILEISVAISIGMALSTLEKIPINRRCGETPAR